ncbi:hypothetical protein Hanom_Chr06g00553671 [Helianthus anomalus]
MICRDCHICDVMIATASPGTVILSRTSGSGSWDIKSDPYTNGHFRLLQYYFAGTSSRICSRHHDQGTRFHNYGKSLIEDRRCTGYGNLA